MPGTCARPSRVAPDDQREREQRHDRPGGQERAPEHRSARRGLRQERQERPREHEQPEDREHHARGARDRLDARLDRPRQRAPAGAYSLSHTATLTPSGAAIAMPIARQQHRARRSDRGTRRTSPGSPRRRATAEQARPHVGDALDQHEQHDRPRGHAQPDPGRPAQQVGDAVDQRPAASPDRALARAGPRRGARTARATGATAGRGARSPSCADPVLLHRLLHGPRRRARGTRRRRAARPPSHTTSVRAARPRCRRCRR